MLHNVTQMNKVFEKNELYDKSSLEDDEYKEFLSRQLLLINIIIEFYIKKRNKPSGISLDKYRYAQKDYTFYPENSNI